MPPASASARPRRRAATPPAPDRSGSGRQVRTGVAPQWRVEPLIPGRRTPAPGGRVPAGVVRTGSDRSRRPGPRPVPAARRRSRFRGRARPGPRRGPSAGGVSCAELTAAAPQRVERAVPRRADRDRARVVRRRRREVGCTSTSAAPVGRPSLPRGGLASSCACGRRASAGADDLAGSPCGRVERDETENHDELGPGITSPCSRMDPPRRAVPRQVAPCRVPPACADRSDKRQGRRSQCGDLGGARRKQLRNWKMATEGGGRHSPSTVVWEEEVSQSFC